MQYDYKKMYKKHTEFLQNRPVLIKAYLALNIALTLAFFGAYVARFARALSVRRVRFAPCRGQTAPVQRKGRANYPFAR